MLSRRGNEAEESNETAQDQWRGPGVWPDIECCWKSVELSTDSGFHRSFVAGEEHLALALKLVPFQASLVRSGELQSHLCNVDKVLNVSNMRVEGHCKESSLHLQTFEPWQQPRTIRAVT